MIASLPERVAALPEPARAAFGRLYHMDRVHGRALPPPEMEAWLRRSFGSVEAVREQTVVRVVNRLTLESALFNPLRARRPTGEAASDAQLEEWIAEELAGADFAAPLQRTPADPFGRIEGRYSISASNVAKYDGWHGLVIFEEGHPLRFGPEQLADYLDVALRWLEAAHAHDPDAIYPLITWNCLPKSGATIVHGHMQVSLGRGMHYARPELWRRAAERYAAQQAGSGLGRYFDDLAQVHAGLGLALHRTATLASFVHLTPLRNREVVLLAAGEPALDAARRLAGPLYAVLRALIDRQGVRSFNLAVALPALAPAPERWDGFPVLARVGDRGPALTRRNDWGAMELYGTGTITVDPFEVAERLRADIVTG